MEISDIIKMQMELAESYNEMRNLEKLTRKIHPVFPAKVKDDAQLLVDDLDYLENLANVFDLTNTRYPLPSQMHENTCVIYDGESDSIVVYNADGLACAEIPVQKDWASVSYTQLNHGTVVVRHTTYDALRKAGIAPAEYNSQMDSVLSGKNKELKKSQPLYDFEYISLYSKYGNLIQRNKVSELKSLPSTAGDIASQVGDLIKHGDLYTLSDELFFNPYLFLNIKIKDLKFLNAEQIVGLYNVIKSNYDSANVVASSKDPNEDKLPNSLGYAPEPKLLEKIIRRLNTFLSVKRLTGDKPIRERFSQPLRTAGMPNNNPPNMG